MALFTNEQKIATNFPCCATCVYWNGNIRFEYPDLLYMDIHTQGKCNKTYLGGETQSIVSCQNWEQRYK